MLLEMVGDMLSGHKDSDSHIIDALREIEGVEPKNCLDVGLWRNAVETFPGATGYRGISAILQIPYARHMSTSSFLLYTYKLGASEVCTVCRLN
jgi:hypothetical protein